MKYTPAIIFVIIALFFFLGTFAGDNSDSKALAYILIIPAGISLLLAIIAAAVAYFL